MMLHMQLKAKASRETKRVSLEFSAQKIAKRCILSTRTQHPSSSSIHCFLPCLYNSLNNKNRAPGSRGLDSRAGSFWVEKMPILRFGLVPWFKRKIIDPFLQIIRRGAEPKQLAFSAALGITLGVFPICGVTVFLCGLAIALIGSRCHAPSVMLANFVATPIELSLVLPFLRMGERISGGTHFPLTSDALKKVFTGQASREVLLSVANAMLGWLVASPFILGALYIIFLPVFRCLVVRFGVLPTSPKKQVYPQAEVKLKIRDV